MSAQMLIITLVLVVVVSNCYSKFIFSHSEANDYEFISRAQWAARDPKAVSNVTSPVPLVVVHHSFTPAACYDVEHCCQAMRDMQNFHMDDREWWDIGYNFAIGCDGSVYEGRGWKKEGAHTKGYNNISVGICLIGDWRTEVPPAVMIASLQSLIGDGINKDYIQQNYTLSGHRQYRDTDCPGDALYNIIKKWNHFSQFIKPTLKTPNEI